MRLGSPNKKNIKTTIKNKQTNKQKNETLWPEFYNHWHLQLVATLIYVLKTVMTFNILPYRILIIILFPFREPMTQYLI